MTLLAQAGVAAPSRREAFGMVLLNVRRELVAAVERKGLEDARGNYKIVARIFICPSEDAADRLGDLTAFKALGVTPEYVDGLVRAGFGRIPPDEIVQLKALGVTPAYLAQLRAAGYAPFRSSEVVQMRALGVTPADYARFRHAYGRVDVDRLGDPVALAHLHRVPALLRLAKVERVGVPEFVERLVIIAREHPRKVHQLPKLHASFRSSLPVLHGCFAPGPCRGADRSNRPACNFARRQVGVRAR